MIQADAPMPGSRVITDRAFYLWSGSSMQLYGASQRGSALAGTGAEVGNLSLDRHIEFRSTDRRSLDWPAILSTISLCPCYVDNRQ